jgi:cytochrome c553
MSSPLPPLLPHAEHRPGAQEGRPRRWIRARLVALCGFVVAASGLLVARAADFTPEQLDFFEKRIRPILVTSCHKCHSASAEKLKGGLRLDSREAVLKGGDTRAAVLPGEPERSLLLEAVRYGNPELQMPPKSRLSDTQIADLAAWIKMGAPWTPEAVVAVAATKPAFDLERRRREHWCWQPVKVPTIPEVRAKDWPAQPVDHFVLTRLEQAGLKPAPSASKYSLLRRVYFDLIGLPPTPAEVEAFLRDSSPAAWSEVVDRLLASPRFGERWARHWLDLVRYAETLGHEYDYPNPNAWRYRDYVIRAFNADVPYDQFAIEHIAGDLLDPPRHHPVDGGNESMIGPAFFWLGQRDHSPVDVRLHQAELIDNQIDVLSKTFLGLTVACARCHDHKFDAIGAKDYYALYGVLESSRYAQRSIEPSADLDATISRLQALRMDCRRSVAECWAEAARHLDTDARADRWKKALELWPLAWPANTGRALTTNETEFADFAGKGYEGWFVDGRAFGTEPARPGDLFLGPSEGPVASLVREPTAHSAGLSRRLQGAMRSASFVIERRYVHVLAAGREARVNVPVDNFTMIRDPIYGGLKRVVDRPEPGWITIDVDMWKGHRAYLEFSDVSTPDPADDGHKQGFAKDGWMAVARVVFSDLSEPPRAIGTEPGPELTAEALQQWIAEWQAGRADGATLRRLDWLVNRRVLDLDGTNPPPSWIRLQHLLSAYRNEEARLHEPRRVPSMVEGSPVDEAVFVRGDHRTPGEPAPRRFLTALGGGESGRFHDGSGRLELAQGVASRSNPLFARVFVNRVWLHLFSRGLVPTPDDFGVLGQPPTDPALLDWLAHWCATEGRWQTKALVRLLVTSRAYQMSSRPDDRAAEEKDPANLLWHRADLRRLEGEAIRDSVLALSGRLDDTMFGPPVPIHLTEFMDGRGRPGTSGPLDGAGRRSIYVEVRRNFVSPMMRTFDTPVPHSTVGRRTVSNVPAQSLMLMNDPFVAEQTRAWAARLLQTKPAEPAERVRQLYLAAFGRPPQPAEITRALAFVADQGKLYRATPGLQAARVEETTWADLCHVLLNVKEFVFVN